MGLHKKYIVTGLLTLMIFILNVENSHETDPSTTTPVSALTQDRNLTKQLDNFITNEPLLDQAIAGISVRSAKTGGVIYDHFGDVRLRPASNLKLLTAIAALSVLGKDYTFNTEVFADGKLTETSLKGNLYLKGKGDPTLLPSDFDTIAKKLQKQGISMIEGNIVGDDQWYDDVRHSQDLIWSDEQAYYGAQISALTAAPNDDYDAGTVIIQVSPASKVGEAATITVSPSTNYVTITNNTKTVKGDPEDMTITRQHGTNNITVEGDIPMDANQVKEWISVWEPTNYALELFCQSLAQHGISWTGEVQVGKTTAKAKQLLSHSSIPLEELLHPFMKLSNNGHGETLMKEMGKAIRNQGSWEHGIDVLLEELETYDINTNSLVIRDGSGISHINLIPANVITKLLYSIQGEEWFPELEASLPVAGQRQRMVGGTLRYRMDGISNQATIRAKTGTIATVSALSGFVETTSGDTLIFSILLNNLLDSSDGKSIEDGIVSILTEA